MATAVTRIDRSIAAHDPDLAQAIEDMHPTVLRLRNAEEAVVRYRRAQDDRAAPAAVARMNAIRDTLLARGEKLQIKPASGLRLIIDQHERFREKVGRRPTMEQLTNAVRAAADVLATAALEADALEAAAAASARTARHLAASSANAVEYLEASA